MSDPVLTARGLRAVAGEHVLLDGVDLDLGTGTVVAIVGRSGSGKSTLGYALHGESRPGVTLSGSLRWHGSEVLDLAEPRRRRMRAGTVAMVPQHPAGALNPMRRVGSALRELAVQVRHPDRAAQDDAVARALSGAQLSSERGLLRRFPHQLSGGQQQRVALAQALITDPDLVVLDEPTTGADTVTKSDIAAVLASLAAAGTALVLLTHDLPLARRLADATAVLKDGAIVERGAAARPLIAPEREYTRDLMAAEPALGHVARPPVSRKPPVLVADRIGRRAADRTWLLTDVSLTVRPGGCVALVGRSGAGKTILARCLAGLSAADSGRIRLGETNLAPSARRRTREQRRHVQYVHQDASAGFDARRSVIGQIARTAELLRGLSPEQSHREAEDLLARWSVDPCEAARRPAELSGGQLQRAAVVRGLLARPAVLICDEVTSALDSVNQADLFATLVEMKSDMDIGLVLISHDFAAVSTLADEVHLLDHGRIIESATPRELLDSPRSEPGRELTEAALAHYRGSGGAVTASVDGPALSTNPSRRPSPN